MAQVQSRLERALLESKEADGMSTKPAQLDGLGRKILIGIGVSVLIIAASRFLSKCAREYAIERESKVNTQR